MTFLPSHVRLGIVVLRFDVLKKSKSGKVVNCDSDDDKDVDDDDDEDVSKLVSAAADDQTLLRSSAVDLVFFGLNLKPAILIL